jgi:phosphatidylglycerol:prolipoprotein diacylglycerol transferase
MLDAIAPALAFGIAIGRIGCFLNGCCYGDPCTLPWAVRFPEQSPPWVSEVGRNQIPPDAAYSLGLHPTQIYSTIDGLILFLLLTAFYPLRKRDGQVVGLLLLTYPITRFFIEYLRNDEGVFAAGMTISQLISVGLFACGVVYWIILSRGPAVRFVDTEQAKLTAEPVGTAS